MKLKILILIIFVTTSFSWAQTIKGTVYDDKTNETIIGASITVKGTKIGAVTDFNGQFEFKYSGEYPISLEISSMGYAKSTLVLNINKPKEVLNINLKLDDTVLEEIDLVEQRLSDQQKKSALTVEAMDALAIKETPAVSFYEGLGNLKGVDLTSASIGFKIINTRGFNSTSPVRSLQIIDGVDNQAPGLNFSLGNFLGASELDVLNVDVIAGASTAFYGPNAFNGVISMTTKDPYTFQGVTASIKGGERGLLEAGVRYAEAFKNKDGIEKFAFKLNLYYLQANDWEADNYDPVTDADYGMENPGRYNAVNTYGDEGYQARNNNYDNSLDASETRYVGLGKYFRSGYNEVDLVDYDTKNLKAGLGLFYRFSPELELNYTFNYGTGTTVYQGDNRFSIKGINFFQNKIELKNTDKWFVRAYATNEDAGKSYDAYFTGLKMLDEQMSEKDWNTVYANNWNLFGFGAALESFPDYVPFDPNGGISQQEWYETEYTDFINRNREAIKEMHRQNLKFTDQNKLVPGSEEYNALFNKITSKELIKGGTRLYDKSALYHIQGAYNFDIKNGKISTGGNYRLYAPNSKGNIFDEATFENPRFEDGLVIYDTVFTTITNQEFGVFGGLDYFFLDDKLKAQVTVRLDKNQNFDYLVSPAASVVYNANTKNTFRVSFSSAIRNPTLQDQYLNYNVGVATLKGNLNGYENLITPESFQDYFETLNKNDLEYFDVDPISPEKVKTIEVGYRATLLKRMYLDASYYYSLYDNFIGYVVGIDAKFIDGNPIPLNANVYRVAANASTRVTTQGFNIGINYYLSDVWALNGNYSWNVLNKSEIEDPIIPAYNTPEHKYNIGVTARKFKMPFIKNNNWGFSLNYKWIQGYRFEGSPQFTGDIESYGLLDAQISYNVMPFTFKLGSSNLLNNKVFQVYGGPRVGRMTYISILYEPVFKKKK